MDAKEPPLLTIRHVAEILGVKPKTISQYLVESRGADPTAGKKAGRYADHPFPKPTDYIGKSPWWALGREDEIRDWNDRRAGQGRGGGPKPKAIQPNG